MNRDERIFAAPGLLTDAPSGTRTASPDRLKLGLMHLWRNGYWPDLREPGRFNELVQTRKLLDRDPLLPLFADKVKVKEVVADRRGRARPI